jgi:hypothetical protein
MSMNVGVLSCSAIFIDGDWPPIILQKTQSSTG